MIMMMIHSKHENVLEYMTRRMLNHQSLLMMILVVVMVMMTVMTLLNCSDGGDGDDYDDNEFT